MDNKIKIKMNDTNTAETMKKYTLEAIKNQQIELEKQRTELEKKKKKDINNLRNVIIHKIDNNLHNIQKTAMEGKYNYNLALSNNSNDCNYLNYALDTFLKDHKNVFGEVVRRTHEYNGFKLKANYTEHCSLILDWE